MPLPTPRQGEGEYAFLGRCMADPTMEAEYPDREQRYAVCFSQLGDRGKEVKQQGAGRDLRQKLELEHRFDRIIEQYHQDIVRQFTREVATLGAPVTAASTRDKQLAAILLKHYAAAQDLFGGQVNNELPMDARLTPDERVAIAAALTAYFDRRATDQAGFINQTTDEGMREAVSNAQQEEAGLSKPELAAVAAAALHRHLRGRKEGIVITETQAAAEATKVTEAEVLSGVAPTVTGGSPRTTETTKRWDSVSDSHVRAAHLEADGQEQPVNKPFSVGGQELMYPGDTSRGASLWNVVRCRCSAIYDTAKIAAQRLGVQRR
jgi:hypothetical protein